MKKQSSTYFLHRIKSLAASGHLGCLAGFTAALSIAWQIEAATKVWTGQSGGNWNVAANWSPSGVPASGDSLVFGNIAAGRTRATTNNIAVPRLFTRLTFEDNAYTVRGIPFGVTDGIIASQASGGITVYPDLVLFSNSVVRVVFGGPGSGVSLTMNGQIIGTNGSSLTVSNAGLITLNGQLSQLTGLTKRGGGTLILNEDNTYGGPTRISGGTVKATTASALGSSSGGTTVDSGAALWIDTALTDVTFNEPLTLGGGTLTVSDQTVRWNAAVTTTADSTLDCATGTSLWMNSAIDGAGGLTKTGPGDLYLMASNNYAGLTVIDEGTVYAGNAGALGSGAQGTTINGSGILSLGAYSGLPSSLDFTSESLRFSGTNAWLEYYGNMTWRGSITVDPGCTGRIYGKESSHYPYQYSRLSLPGTVSGTGSLEYWADQFVFSVVMEGNVGNTLSGVTKVYSGQLLLQKADGVYSIAGPLEIHGYDVSDFIVGRVSVGAHDQLTGCSLSMYDGGQLLLNGYRADAVQLFMHGGHIYPGLGGELALWTYHAIVVSDDGGIIGDPNEGILWVNVHNPGMIEVGTNSFLAIGANLINDAMIFDKTGPGELVLKGQNGLATVWLWEGMLQVNGMPGPNEVVMTNNTVLGGSGSIGSVDASGGKIFPGQQRLTIGELFMSSNVTFAVELNGPIAGTNYGQLKAGSAVLGSAKLEISLGFVPASDATFTVIDHVPPGPVSGTFAGLPEGAHVTSGGIPHSFRVSYVGGDGNDVVLTSEGTPAASFTRLWMQNDGMWMEASGVPGTPYVLEATTDLKPPIVWLPLRTNTASAGGLVSFTDSDVSLHAQRFYRIRSP